MIGELQMRLPIDGSYGARRRGRDGERRRPVARGGRADSVHLHLDADRLVRAGGRLVLEQVLARDLLAQLVEERREVLRRSPARTRRLRPPRAP